MSVIDVDSGALNTVIARNGVDVTTNEVSNRVTSTQLGFGPKSRCIGEGAKNQEVSNLQNKIEWIWSELNNDYYCYDPTQRCYFWARDHFLFDAELGQYVQREPHPQSSSTPFTVQHNTAKNLRGAYDAPSYRSHYYPSNDEAPDREQIRTDNHESNLRAYQAPTRPPNFFVRGKVFRIPWLELSDSGPKVIESSKNFEPAEGNSKYLKNRKPKEVTTRIFEIPGHLSHTHFTNALGDYCAKQNFMKDEYAARLGLTIDRSEVSKVAIGNGKKVSTKGTAKTLFSFAGEKKGYQLSFHLLPSCIHDVILGKPFLKATSTFKSVVNFARRVRQRIMKGIAQHRLLYLGDSAPRFKGLVNGIPQDALADSGAKVSVMNEDYARFLGIPIHKGEEHRARLRFADNSTAHTSGMAYDVKWEFGSGEIGEEHRLDFHILKDAPANIILRDTFLFDIGAFSKYDCFLVDDDEEDEEGYFFAIDVDQSNPGEGHLNMSSLANIRHAENVLRGQNEDAIANIPQDKQAIAWQAENERRSRWERRFAALQLCQTSGNGAHSLPVANPSASFSSPQGIREGKAGAAHHARFWSRFKLKRKSPA